LHNGATRLLCVCIVQGNRTANGSQMEHDCGREMKAAAAACVKPRTSV
jgi:hypothetical protein